MHAIVVLGGEPPDCRVAAHFPPTPDFVIGADSGVAHARMLGLTVDLAVGDFDSLTDLSMLDGLEVQSYSPDKDATDGELAAIAAVDRGATAITFVTGGDPARLDHLFAAVGLFGSNRLAHVEVTGWVGATRLRVVRSRTQWGAPPGRLVSVIPLNGPATGVTLTGLHWPLDNVDMAAGTTLGVSNLTTHQPACVEVLTGTLLVLEPEALS